MILLCRIILHSLVVSCALDRHTEGPVRGPCRRGEQLCCELLLLEGQRGPHPAACLLAAEKVWFQNLLQYAIN